MLLAVVLVIIIMDPNNPKSFRPTGRVLGGHSPPYLIMCLISERIVVKKISSRPSNITRSLSGIDSVEAPNITTLPKVYAVKMRPWESAFGLRM